MTSDPAVLGDTITRAWSGSSVLGDPGRPSSAGPPEDRLVEACRGRRRHPAPILTLAWVILDACLPSFLPSGMTAKKG